MDGLLILDKPAGMTSHTATDRVRKLLGADKAGHTGTLDPMATGVLPVLLGRAVKAASYMVEGDKRYLAGMRLGLTTDTEDTTGRVLTRTDELPDEAAVAAAVRSMIGEIEQVPPMYSALKIGGKKLADLARRGVTVERPARTIRIYALGVRRESETDYLLDVRCSKGTYVRTLCADIGKKLGCGAVMSRLCRAEAGGFLLKDAISLENLAAMTADERAARLLSPADTVLAVYPAYTPADYPAHLLYHGCAVRLAKLGGVPAAAPGERVRLYDRRGFFAVAAVVPDPAEPTELCLQVEKIFRLDPPDAD